MIVKTANSEFVIRWNHNAKGHDAQANELRATTCTLLTGDDEITAMAACSKQDQFCKDRGRKISLARAMKTAGIPLETRKQVWDVVLAETRGSHRKGKK